VVAKDLKELEGFDTKEKLADWLAKNAITPAWHYWARGPNQLKQAKEGIEPFASWLKLGDMAFVPVSPFLRPVRKTASGPKSPPGQGAVPAKAPPKVAPKSGAPAGQPPIDIIVVGGGTNPYWVGGDFRYVASASIDNWR
jgi:hypothetical protein